MKLVAPHYYDDFRCTADKCKHNCCIGWEIDVDEITLEYYDSLSGEIGEKLKKNISREGDTPHFVLAENERCPFLMKNNLCELICKLGDDALCDICADHPRFRNFFSDREEMGLGLCCESAGRLVLSNKDKIEFVTLADDKENDELTETEKTVLNTREKLFEIALCRDKTLSEKIDSMLGLCKLKRKVRSRSEWADVFLSMERLDESWTELLISFKNSACKNSELKDKEKWEKPFSQLLFYFIYRHFSPSAEDGRLWERLLFAIDSCIFVREICIFHEETSGELDFEDLVEYCRKYSSEMEYSEENVENYLNVC